MLLQMSSQRYERQHLLHTQHHQKQQQLLLLQQQQQQQRHQNGRRQDIGPDPASTKATPEFQRDHHYPQHQPQERQSQGLSMDWKDAPTDAGIMSSDTANTCDLARVNVCGKGLLFSPPPSPPPPFTSTSAASPPRAGRTSPFGLRLSIPATMGKEKLPWVSLEGLVSCALACLKKDECSRIATLGMFLHFDNSMPIHTLNTLPLCSSIVSSSDLVFVGDVDGRARGARLTPIQPHRCGEMFRELTADAADRCQPHTYVSNPPPLSSLLDLSSSPSPATVTIRSLGPSSPSPSLP